MRARAASRRCPHRQKRVTGRVTDLPLRAGSDRRSAGKWKRG
jgi:hypothetical protein